MTQKPRVTAGTLVSACFVPSLIGDGLPLSCWIALMNPAGTNAADHRTDTPRSTVIWALQALDLSALDARAGVRSACPRWCPSRIEKMLRPAMNLLEDGRR